MARYERPSVCKPCWELKYCPYGPLVEQFPLRISQADAGNPEECITHIRGVYNQFVQAASEETDPEIVETYIEPLNYFNPATWTTALRYDPEDATCSVFGHVCPV